MKKPLSINLPYPTVEGEISDKNSVSKLSFLYAGKHGELNAILQYTYHYFYFKRLNDEETAEIATQENIETQEALEQKGTENE